MDDGGGVLKKWRCLWCENVGRVWLTLLGHIRATWKIVNLQYSNLFDPQHLDPPHDVLFGEENGVDLAKEK